jgi:hypothetical protein
MSGEAKDRRFFQEKVGVYQWKINIMKWFWK